MDYAFAPGTDSKVKVLQRLLRDRTDGAQLDTQLIDTPSHVAGFIAHIDSSLPKPTGDLLIGSHGNDTGWLEIDMDALSGRSVSYAVVKDLIADATRRAKLSIPPSFYTDAQGNRVPNRVLIKGCRVGMQPKFVDALHILFGGQTPVIAARHFLSARAADKRRGRRFIGKIGTFEHLLYSFEITSPTALTRAQLLTGFRARNFQQFNATAQTPSPVPDLWDTWLPRRKLGVGKQPISYTVSLGRTIQKLKTLPTAAEFRHTTPKLTLRINNPPPAVKTRAGFKAALAQRPDYKTGWGPTSFPVQEQYGHTSFDAFFDSFTWTPSKDKNADPFIWVGERHEYNVILPVVQPPMTGKAADRLIYNFFPQRGTAGVVQDLFEGTPGLFYIRP